MSKAEEIGWNQSRTHAGLRQRRKAIQPLKVVRPSISKMEAALRRCRSPSARADSQIYFYIR